MTRAGGPLDRLLAGAVPYALPMRRRFRGQQVREGVLIEGPSGWGEFAPFPEYAPAVCARWLAAAIEAAYGSWPPPVRTEIPVNAIVPAVPADDAAGLTREAVARGCTTIKVKVAEPGQGPDDDEARVAAVRAALDDALSPGRGRIRIDANGGWSVPEAGAVLRRLAAYGLEYAEQPCATLAELAVLRRSVPVPIAADEVVRGAADPGRVDLREAADIVVLKVPPLGGVASGLAVARALGRPAVVSGALDSAVGLGAGLALAAALPALPHACGLGTGALLAADVVDPPLVPRAGCLAAGRRAPEPAALQAARDRLPPERADAWRALLAAAWTAGVAAPAADLVRSAG